MTYQTRYIEYARVHGYTPDAMVERDRERYPGGANSGYIRWLQARLGEWRDEAGYQGPMIGAWQGEFDRWLAALPVEEA